LIFCQPNGAYYSPDRVGARVKELMVSVGLEGVSLHSLRHTNATELLRNGVPIAEVSRRLGHADQNITLSIYSHAVPADSRAAAKVWNDALGDVIQTSKKPAAAQSIAESCRVLHGDHQIESFCWKQKEESGGDDGARTRDLRRDRFAFWACQIMELPVLSAACERQGPT